MEKSVSKKVLKEVPDDNLKNVTGGGQISKDVDPSNGGPALIFGNQCYTDCMQRTGDAARCKKQCVQ